MGKHVRSKRIKIIFTFVTVFGAVTGADSLSRAGETLSGSNSQVNRPADSNPQNAIGSAPGLDQTSQEIGSEDERRRRTEFANRLIVWVKVLRRRIVPVIMLGYVVVGVLFVLRAIVNQLSKL